MARRTIFLTSLLCVLACRDEPRPSLGCSALPDEAAIPLCKRFEQKAFGLEHMHGQVFGAQHWACLQTGVRAVFCDDPQVSRAVLEGLLQADRAYDQGQVYRIDHGRAPANEPTDRVPVDGLLVECTQMLLGMLDLARTNPGWTATTCGK